MASKLQKLVLATNNINKQLEIKNLLKNSSIQIVEVNNDFNPEENGETFEENAYIKAFEAAKLMGIPALADDSGLEVDALNGAPGIFSSRYAENDQKRIERILYELKDVKPENRTARFICAMVIVAPDGETLHSCLGKCEGIIIDKPTGEHGFGYDPIFYIPEMNATMAQINIDEKNKVSHRSRALRCMIEWLKD